MIYRPRHFELDELIPPDLRRGEAAWELLDPRALMMLDALRDKFGPITVNDWSWGGTFKESGYRSATSRTGAKYSQHRYGRAFDCKFGHVTVQGVYTYLIEHPDEFPYITTLEDIGATPTWLHFDCRNNPNPGIRVVNP